MSPLPHPIPHVERVVVVVAVSERLVGIYLHHGLVWLSGWLTNTRGTAYRLVLILALVTWSSIA
jgi:hypothetical protein